MNCDLIFSVITASDLPHTPTAIPPFKKTYILTNILVKITQNMIISLQKLCSMKVQVYLAH